MCECLYVCVEGIGRSLNDVSCMLLLHDLPSHTTHNLPFSLHPPHPSIHACTHGTGPRIWSAASRKPCGSTPWPSTSVRAAFFFQILANMHVCACLHVYRQVQFAVLSAFMHECLRCVPACAYTPARVMPTHASYMHTNNTRSTINHSHPPVHTHKPPSSHRLLMLPSAHGAAGHDPRRLPHPPKLRRLGA